MFKNIMAWVGTILFMLTLVLVAMGHASLYVVGSEGNTGAEMGNYWIQKAEDTNMASLAECRASLASAYYLKEIYLEEKKQTKLLQHMDKYSVYQE